MTKGQVSTEKKRDREEKEKGNLQSSSLEQPEKRGLMVVASLLRPILVP